VTRGSRAPGAAAAGLVMEAAASANGRVVSAPEGGYDLQAPGRSAVAHVEALARG